MSPYCKVSKVVGGSCISFYFIHLVNYSADLSPSAVWNHILQHMWGCMFWVLTLLLFNYLCPKIHAAADRYWYLILDISRSYRTELVGPVSFMFQDLFKPRPALLYIYQRLTIMTVMNTRGYEGSQWFRAKGNEMSGGRDHNSWLGVCCFRCGFQW